MTGRATRKPPALRSDRIRVALVAPGDAAALRDFHRRNRAYLRPWMPPTAADFETTGYWRRWTAAAPVLFAEDRAVRLVIRERATPDGPVLGQVNLSNIVRGAFQAAHLGYHLDHAAEGHGMMSEALRLVVDHAFGPLSLHRLMANYVIGNARSAKVLARLGFRVEGVAKSYLFIGGAWRDHVLTALVDPTGRPPPPPYTKGHR
ncbi:MAG: GNAT family N-acetyltransferase [Inquilinus sp.]|nr:GNAT family N-acetyltransferase [Inquilinus sp.]